MFELLWKVKSLEVLIPSHFRIIFSFERYSTMLNNFMSTQTPFVLERSPTSRLQTFKHFMLIGPSFKSRRQISRCTCSIQYLVPMELIYVVMETSRFPIPTTVRVQRVSPGIVIHILQKDKWPSYSEPTSMHQLHVFIYIVPCCMANLLIWLPCSARPDGRLRKGLLWRKRTITHTCISFKCNSLLQQYANEHFDLYLLSI